MEAIEKEYFYIIEKKIDVKKDARVDLKHHFMLEIEIPYHLRYGAANDEGITMRELHLEFIVASNCIKNFGNEEKQVNKTNEYFKWVKKTIGRQSHLTFQRT